MLGNLVMVIVIVIGAFIIGVIFGDSRTERKYVELMRKDHNRIQKNLNEQYLLGYSEGLKDATLEQKGDYNG